MNRPTLLSLLLGIAAGTVAYWFFNQNLVAGAAYAFAIGLVASTALGRWL